MKKGSTLLTQLILLVIVLAITGLVALWTQSNLDFWISYFKKEAVNIPYWIAFLLTALTNVFGIIGNIVMELAKFLV